MTAPQAGVPWFRLLTTGTNADLPLWAAKTEKEVREPHTKHVEFSWRHPEWSLHKSPRQTVVPEKEACVC